MFFSRWLRASSLLLVSVAALAGKAIGQGAAWSDQFDRPGLLGRVFALSDYGGELVAGGLPIEADGLEFGCVARWDGQHWLPLGQGIQGSIVRDFALYQNQLVAAGSFWSAGGAAADSIASWDGAQWQALGGGIQGTVFALEVYQNELYAAGVFASAGGVATANIARWDGAQWLAVGSGFDGDVYALLAGADGKLYAGGAFGHAGGVSAANIAAWDGVSWSPVGAGIGVPFNSPVRALAWHASKLWAGGAFDLPGGALYEKLASWNGSTWHGEGSFPDSSIGTQIYALLSVGTELYVGGSIVTVDSLPIDRIARLSGSQWTSIGGVRGFGNTNVVLALTLHAGELVIGGNFTHAGTSFVPGVPVVTNSIASFDGAIWKQIGKGLGFNGAVSSGMLWNGGVVVVGSFNEAGRSLAPYVAFFDGVDWTRLAELDGPAYDLCVFQGELVVAGNFSSVDGQSIIGVAAFNGTSWHGFGSGFGGGYGGQTVAVYQNQLYAGTIGGVQRWSGSSWAAFAPQIFGSVGDLYVHNNILYIAGLFTLTGGNIASWDGSTQQIVGGGMNDYVDTLTSFGGDLVAGGIFTQAGGLPANRLARWNGTSWSAIPGITGQEVTKLAVLGGELYAGGNPLLSGPAYSYIARFDGAQWQPLGGGLDGPAAALIPDEAAGRLYAGGLFQNAEGRPSWNFASWGPPSIAVGTSFCFGDGSLTDHTTPCPCGNFGAAGNGCANSFNAAGAHLAASGSTASDTVSLSGSGVPTTSFTLFMQHEAAGDFVFHDGVLCAGGTLIRLRGRVAQAGTVSFPDSTDTQTLSQRGNVTPGSGARRYYAAWYRNASTTFCPPATANVSNGLRIDW